MKSLPLILSVGASLLAAERFCEHSATLISTPEFSAGERGSSAPGDAGISGVAQTGRKTAASPEAASSLPVSPASAPKPEAGALPPAPPAGLSSEQWQRVREQIAEARRTFSSATDGAWHAVSPRGETLELSPDGSATFRLHSGRKPGQAGRPLTHTASLGAGMPPDASMSLRSTAMGRTDAMAPLAGVAAEAAGHSAERKLAPGLTEWWRSEERGFEFGWRLTDRPGGTGQLRLEMKLDCPWQGEVSPSGRSAVFRDPSGSGWQIACQDLAATDAAGRLLDARMQLTRDSLTFLIDDAAAQYPVEIDPWILASLPVLVNSPSPSGDAAFGLGVELHGDVLLVAEGIDSVGNVSLDVFAWNGSGYVLRRTIPNLIPGYTCGAVCGNTIVAGPFYGPGGTYLFRCLDRNTGGPNAWGEVQQFSATAPTGLIAYDFNGWVALGPDYLVIRDPYFTTGDPAARGRVQLFTRVPGAGVTWTAAGAITAPQAVAKRFGFNIAADGPALIVCGITSADEMAEYALRRAGSSWVFEKTVVLAGFPLFSEFLPTVALSGDSMAVGIVGLDEVRIFDRDAGGSGQWGLAKTIAGPASSNFGLAIGLEGDLLVAGSPDENIDHDNNPGTAAIEAAGAIRSYARNTGGINAWGQTGILHKGSAAKAHGHYGWALSLNCGRLAVGYADGDSVNPVVADAGIVEIYTASSGLDLRSTVANPTAWNGTDYGAAVALDGPYLLVGAPLYDPIVPGGGLGAAFLFRDRTLVKSWFGESLGDHFGQAVALDRDRVVIGAPLRPGVSGGVAYGSLGKVYIYERNQGGAENWGQAAAFLPALSALSTASPQFGSSLALSGERLAVGSPYETGSIVANAQGRVRLFERNQGGAGNWGQVVLLAGNDSGAAERFGYALDFSGDTVAVGAPLEDQGGLVNVGAVYLFRRNQGGGDAWGRIARITMPGPAADSTFGTAVGLDGNDLVVGASREDRGGAANAGAAYFFATGLPNYDVWTFEARVQPDDLLANHNFGQAVAISHGRAIIGSPVPAAAEPSAAAAWVYTRSGLASNPWKLEGKYTVPDPDSFGAAVAIDGESFVVADPTADVLVSSILQVDRGEVYQWSRLASEWAPMAADGGNAGSGAVGSAVALLNNMLVAGGPAESVGGFVEAGAAYVFERNGLSVGGWSLTQRLTDPAGAAAAAHFGSALAMDAQWLAVGAPGARKVALFSRGGSASPTKPWTTAGVSLTVAPAQTDQFGASLAMADGRLLVGAPLRTGGGAAFIFDRNQSGSNAWGLLRTVTASDAAAGDAFGTAVALNATTAVVGAPLDDTAAGADAGSVYVFARNNGGADLWGQLKKITAPSGAAGDQLGQAVALADFLVLAGMPGDDTTAGTNAGSALLFARNFGGAENYGLIRTFNAPDASAQAAFGSVVAVDTTHAIVSAPFADPGGLNSAGEVYVFSRNYGGSDSWGLLQALAPNELPAGSQFGASLAIDHTTLAAGAPFVPLGSAQGAVELFSFRGRTVYDELAASWGLDGANAVPMGDADGDGQENLLEISLGSDPGDPNSFGTTPILVSGGYLIATFPKSAPCSGLNLVSAETSSDLLTWTAVTPAMILQDDDALLRVQVPLVPGQKKFIRFRVSEP